jgi:hypothetical protein
MEIQQKREQQLRKQADECRRNASSLYQLYKQRGTESLKKQASQVPASLLTLSLACISAAFSLCLFLRVSQHLQWKKKYESQADKIFNQLSKLRETRDGILDARNAKSQYEALESGQKEMQSQLNGLSESKVSELDDRHSETQSELERISVRLLTTVSLSQSFNRCAKPECRLDRTRLEHRAVLHYLGTTNSMQNLASSTRSTRRIWNQRRPV